MRRPARTPPYPPTLEACLAMLAASERNEPGKLASWLRAQRPLVEVLRPRAGRAIFVNVKELGRG